MDQTYIAIHFFVFITNLLTIIATLQVQILMLVEKQINIAYKVVIKITIFNIVKPDIAYW